MIHNMTPTLTTALKTLAGQQLAALTMPGAERRVRMRALRRRARRAEPGPHSGRKRC